MEVLDQIDEAVRACLARAPVPPEDPPHDDQAPASLEALNARLDQWSASRARLEAEAEAAARAITADEEALSAWVSQLRELASEKEASLARLSPAFRPGPSRAE
jgi:hypothetical protein